MSDLGEAINATVCSVCEGIEDDHTGCANAVQHFLSQSQAANEALKGELARVDRARSRL